MTQKNIIMRMYNKSTNEWENLSPITNDENVINGDGKSIKSQIDSINERMDNMDVSHNINKDDVGLSNVDNVKQASKEEFDELNNDVNIHLSDYHQFKNNTEDIMNNLQQEISEKLGSSRESLIDSYNEIIKM